MKSCVNWRAHALHDTTYNGLVRNKSTEKNPLQVGVVVVLVQVGLRTDGNLKQIDSEAVKKKQYHKLKSLL